MYGRPNADGATHVVLRCYEHLAQFRRGSARRCLEPGRVSPDQPEERLHVLQTIFRRQRDLLCRFLDMRFVALFTVS